MLVISKDGELDIGRVEIDVKSAGKVLLANSYRVPKEAELPTSLAIVSNGDETAQATITVVAWQVTPGQDDVPLDRRDAIVTQIPTDRLVALKVVLSARCSDKVELVGEEAVSTCSEGTTCEPATGACTGSVMVDASELDDYSEDDLSPTPGGGGSAGNAGTGGTEASGGAAGNSPDEPIGGGDSGEGGIGPTEPPGGSGPGNAGEGGSGEPVDECPDDDMKTAPGACGCGLPDVATAGLVGCAQLEGKLIHRYDFEGLEGSTTITDQVGSAHGFAINTALTELDGKSVLLLGDSGEHGDLPNGLISSLSNATIEAWVEIHGGGAWQRIFDFGYSTGGENAQGQGTTYLYVTPNALPGNVPRLAFSLNGSAMEDRVDGASAFPLNTLTQVVVVANDAGDQLSLYINGAQVGSTQWLDSLSNLTDDNVWLGQSQNELDPAFAGRFHELRIYNAALSPTEIATAHLAGPDPLFLAD